MTTIFFRIFSLFLLAATLLGTVGCEQAKEGSGTSRISQHDHSENGAADEDSDRIAIDELLARTDITEAARNSLERAKKLGQESLTRDNAELIIKNSYRLEPKSVEVKNRYRVESTVLPSLSRHDGQIDDSFPGDALSARAYLKGSSERALIGIDHFKSRPIYKLSGATRQACIEWMNRIFKMLSYADSVDAWSELAKEGDDLRTQCSGLQDEPMFCLCRGVVAGELKDQNVANRLFLKATEQFSVSYYPTLLPILSYHYKARYVTHVLTEGNAERIAAHVKRAAAYKHWIDQDLRTSGHDQRFMLTDVKLWIKRLFHANAMDALKEFWDAVTDSKQLTPWQREMILGRLNLETGYYYRGTGFADSVTEEGWEKLELYCGLAHEHFERALEINPRFPEPAVELMSIASMGYSDREPEEWFELATKFEPEYLWAYSMRQNYLRARWGGAPDEQVEFFMEQSKNTDSGAVAFLLPESLFRLKWQDEMEDDAWKELITKPDIMKEVLAVLDKILANEEEVVINQRIYKRDFFLTVKAFFAFESGQFEVAEKTFDELDGRINRAAVAKLGLVGAGYELLRSSAYAFTCEYQNRALEINKLMSNSLEERIKRADKILDLTEDMSEWVDVNSGGLFFKLARERVLLETKYASGEQIDLFFDENFTLWKSTDFTQNEFLSPTSVKLDNRIGNPKFSLIHGAETPGNKIFASDFELPANDKETSKDTSEALFCPALVMGSIIYEDTQAFQAFAVGISRTPPKEFNNPKVNGALSGKLSFGSNDSKSPLFQYYFDLKPGKNRLKVFFGSKYFEIYVNDQFVCRSFSKRFEPIRHVKIAQPGAANGRGIATVSNLTLQRWQAGPPPTVNKASEALIEYYTKVCEEEPKNRWPVFWLAHSLHLKKDYDAAIPLYQKAVEMGVNRRFAGFYLGDALARAGEYKQSKIWYQQVVDSQGPSYPMLRQDPPNHILRNGSIQEWAAFRLKWGLVSQEGGVSIGNGLLTRLNKMHPTSVVEGPSFSAIAYSLCNSEHSTPETIRERIETHIKFHDKLNAQQREKISPLLAALASGQPYAEAEDDRPLYLSFENKEKVLFQHFERRHLHFRWRHFYERLVDYE